MTTPPSLAARALILDYGCVLCLPQRPDRVATMAARLDVPIDLFARVYRAERMAYDSGEPTEQYWRRVLAILDRASLFSPSFLAATVEDDAASWMDQAEEVWTIAADFRARGGRLAFLSNNVPPLMARLRAERRLEQSFDVVIASCEVGIAKPDPAIFHLCLDALSVAPADALFVDDHAPNIAAATALGIRTFYFDGDNAATRLRAATEAKPSTR